MIRTLEYFLAYAAVPLTGWHLYVRLHRRMSDAGVADPPGVPLFLVFTAYGGWLVVPLVIVSRAWNGWMVFVLFYAGLVAPLLMLYLTVTLYGQRRASKYHLWALLGSGGYLCLCALTPLLLIIMVALSGSD